jgi:hypothetical protein
MILRNERRRIVADLDGLQVKVNGLPLAALGDFVRGRMGASQSTRQVVGRACRDLEGLFESLLAEAFHE